MMEVDKNAKKHTEDESSVLLFDGMCHMCSWAVRFIIRRDPHARIRFASLQSEVGRQLLADSGNHMSNLDSVVLIENGRSYIRTAATLRVCRKLRGAWPLLYGFIVVPRPLRDALYNWIARNRYRWFGRSDTCMLPSASDRSRFLDV